MIFEEFKAWFDIAFFIAFFGIGAFGWAIGYGRGRSDERESRRRHGSRKNRRITHYYTPLCVDNPYDARNVRYVRSHRETR